MPTATWNVDRADHELRARQAHALWSLTRERYRREIECHQRGAELFAIRRDPERRFVERMRSGSAAVAA
jgi:hypothetical protein